MHGSPFKLGIEESSGVLDDGAKDIATFIGQLSESLEELPPEPLVGETVFKDLKAWDSLAVLTVTDTIDMEYGVLLKKSDYADCATIADLYALVESKRGS